MSVKSQVQAAEEALRQALINALAEGDEEFLSELFTEYQKVSDLNRKVSEKINIDPNFSFTLSSDYLNTDRIGGDLDALDNITFAAGPVNLPGALGEDVISFSDYKSQEYRPDQSREDYKSALVGMVLGPLGFLLPKSKWCGWDTLPPGFLFPVKE